MSETNVKPDGTPGQKEENIETVLVYMAQPRCIVILLEKQGDRQNSWQQIQKTKKQPFQWVRMVVLSPFTFTSRYTVFHKWGLNKNISDKKWAEFLVQIVETKTKDAYMRKKESHSRRTAHFRRTKMKKKILWTFYQLIRKCWQNENLENYNSPQMTWGRKENLNTATAPPLKTMLDGFMVNNTNHFGTNTNLI